MKALRFFFLLSIAHSLAASDLPVVGPTPEERLARAAGMLEERNVGKQQRALSVLGRLETPGAEKLLLAQFDRLAADQLPLPLWLDLFEAAAKHRSPALQARLAERERAGAEANDPLVRFRECLEGGDADAGREVFAEAPQAGCIRCHSVNGQGGQIGPELAGLGLRTDRIYILESILVPDATTVFGFTHILLNLKNGEVVSGILSTESRDEVTITSIADGAKRKVKTRQIASRTGLPSAMPPIFGQALTKRQIRDLVEYITTAEPE